MILKKGELKFSQSKNLWYIHDEDNRYYCLDECFDLAIKISYHYLPCLFNSIKNHVDFINASFSLDKSSSYDVEFSLWDDVFDIPF